MSDRHAHVRLWTLPGLLAGVLVGVAGLLIALATDSVFAFVVYGFLLSLPTGFVFELPVWGPQTPDWLMLGVVVSTLGINTALVAGVIAWIVVAVRTRRPTRGR